MFTVSSPRIARPRFLTAFWLVCLSLWLPALAFAQTSVTPSGNGLTTTTAYQITNLGNLVWMANNVSASSGVYYALANDIDANATAASDYDSAAGFAPIGSSSHPFRGIFLGNGHTISNLTIRRPSINYIGLFGYIGSGGVLHDLTLTNCSISGSSYVGGLAGYTTGTILSACSVSGDIMGNYDYTGGLVGYINAGTSIRACSASGNVTGSSDCVGGLVGIGEGAVTISNCSASGDVTGGENMVGGLVGCIYSDGESAIIRQCFATGNVTGVHWTGGLLGRAYGMTTITNCFASGEVTAPTGECVGGLIGYAYIDVMISHCSAFGNVSGGDLCVGGFIGWNDSGSMSGCSASGDVSGTERVGGFAGETGGPISACSAAGNVSGTKDVGGLTGVAEYARNTVLSDCYATGDVAGGPFFVGGLVGEAYGNISTSFATGYVSGGTQYIGGLTGFYSSISALTITDCYWDTIRSGQVGAVENEAYTGVTGATTADMRKQATFSGFDFTTDYIWGIKEEVSYPWLRQSDVVVFRYVINEGAETTYSPFVTLSTLAGLNPTHYMASEDPTFTDASLGDTAWKTYKRESSFTLSAGTGEKTVYFKVCNDYGTTGTTTDDVESDLTSATITLAAPTVTSFSINNGATLTYSSEVTLQNTATGYPTYYKVSDVANLTTATWQAYSTSGNFTLTGANGSKTLYFQVKNDFAESAIVSASINLLAADMAFVKNSVTVQSAHTETYAAKTKAITSKDTYAFKASVQLPGTFASINATTQFNLQIGNLTFSQPLSAAISSSLKGTKGGSAVFRTQVTAGTKKVTTQIITLTWSKTGLLKIVVTGTPLAGTGSVLTTNILNALSTEDGSIAANVPIAVGIGSDYARNTTGVVCTGVRTTKMVKNTAVNLNNWVMTGKK